MIGGQRKSRKTRRRRRCVQPGDVYVLYESGAPEGMKFVGVFRTLEAAKTKVEALIELLNNDLEEERQFKMDVRDDGMMAWSESEPNAFYCKVAKFQ